MADVDPAVLPDETVDALMAALDDTDCPDQDHLLCRRCASAVASATVAPLVARVRGEIAAQLAWADKELITDDGFVQACVRAALTDVQAAFDGPDEGGAGV